MIVSKPPRLVMGSRLREAVGFFFELFCEVSPGDRNQEPHIVNKYPESYKNEEELKSIPKFTFPCQIDTTFVQHYSFVLTSEESKYTFCFCRYDPRTNTALVLLSFLPWHEIFYRLLNCIASLLSGTEADELHQFLEACRFGPPLRGHTLKVTYNNGQSVFLCQWPEPKLPSIPEDCNLTEYFSAVDTKCMAGVWAALLQERRVIFVASKPARLTACVQAANATLFPMAWQHIFIPILPQHLVDYLLAPMPFLVGVPRSVMETVSMAEIGDVVILDVDEKELMSPFNDLDCLPPDMIASLQRALSDKDALGDTVSRAFLRALVCLIGGYRDAIRIEKGQYITFNNEAFVKTRKNMQPFLRKIVQSQIFQQFVDERLELLNSGHGFNDEFEVECNIYAERMNSGSGQRLKQQYREWAKTVRKEGGAFLKTVKDKANPAVQSAVKTVRQGGKNVKSAVKGLKSKMPKSSRSSSMNPDSRFSCGSEAADSSDSDSAPPRESPRRDRSPALPLDLLNEMEFLFANNSRRPDSLPNCNRNALSLQDRARTLSPLPPSLPKRPNVPSRYTIVSTRRLVDVSDAPTPPPRNIAPTHFVTNITRNERTADFHTSTIRIADGAGGARLALTSTRHRKPPPPPPKDSPPHLPPPLCAKPETRPRPPAQGNIPESSDSVSDLIKLDDTPTVLEDFDPLKQSDKDAKDEPKSSADSALLHEYGLDFSQFGLDDSDGASNAPPDASTGGGVPKGWTTFN